jgi:hypothetical protein
MPVTLSLEPGPQYATTRSTSTPTGVHCNSSGHAVLLVLLRTLGVSGFIRQMELIGCLVAWYRGLPGEMILLFQHKARLVLISGCHQLDKPVF